MKFPSPARVARIFTACSTPARCLRAHHLLTRGQFPELAEALWCHAMSLRSPPDADQWRALRSAALARLDARR